jgi:hypothetical protein
MRSVVAVFFALAVASPSSAADLRLDHRLLGETANTLSTAGAVAPLPVFDALIAEQGDGGGRNLPPQVSGVGLGLQVGSPTAVTIKIGGLQQNGFVIGIGAGFAYYGAFAPNLSVHVDYLFHVATLVRTGDVALTAYVGPGLWLALGTYGYGFGLYKAGYFGYFPFGVGVRVPLGLSLGFSAAPVEIYLELDPALFFFPPADFGVGASLGFRWHF